MFIDASAIVAILAREPGHEEIEKRLAAAEGPFFLSPLVKFEAAVALARQKAGSAPTSASLLRQAEAAVDAFAEDIDAQEVPVSAETGRLALSAAATYGKAVGHAAALNFGDCFAHACATGLRVPLLYKGNDFALADLA